MNPERSERIEIPVLPLRDVVVYPHMVIPLFVGREKSIRCLEAAMDHDKKIMLVAQKEASTDEPGVNDLFTVGTVASILQMLKLPDGTVKVLVEGLQRARISALSDNGEHFSAKAEYLESPTIDEREQEVLVRTAISQFEGYIKLNKKIPPEVLTSLNSIDDPARLADTIAAHMPLKLADKQSVLEMSDVNERLEYLGDAVIEAVTSDYLFIEYPDRDEGFMTQLRSKIVSRQSLNALAVNLGLDVHVISNGGTGITQKHIYGDAFEAMMGAVYLDQGYEFVNRLLINNIYFRFLNLEELTESESDFKSRLIEWSQKNKRALSFDTVPSPLYTQKIPHFHTSVSIDGQPTGTGEGHSKKSSEQKAALSALIRLRETGEHGTAEHIEE